jgi:hypothetical protein
MATRTIIPSKIGSARKGLSNPQGV